MNRYFDKNFVEALHIFNLHLNQNERNNLRKYYYYGITDYLKSTKLTPFPQYQATETDKLNVLNSFILRCKTYRSEQIINSVLERHSHTKSQVLQDNTSEWLNYFNLKRKSQSEFSLFIYDYTQDNFVEDNYSCQNIFKTIADIYDRLENYRYFIFKLHGKLFNKQNHDVTWKVLYKIGIYCENFIQYKDKFFPFKQEKQIQKLTLFLNERFKNNDNEKLALDFYSTISTGFKFEDCLISENQDDIILTFQKIKLDLNPVPCPACMSTIQNGNSFPEMFLRSYECKNPSCSERSKSGRGKRFDEYSTYRYFKLCENKKENKISETLYSKWRRDIFSISNDIYEMLISYYAYDNETICISKKLDIKNKNERRVVYYKASNNVKHNIDFEKAPIVILFSKIAQLIDNEIKLLTTDFTRRKLENDIEILNENSTENIFLYAQNQIGAAITSPPYYNAREYSQWSNMLMYFIDMQKNASGVHHALCDGGYYLYNIGDIVNADNVYVESNMSKKRLQLGFLSCLIFEKSGFNLVGNIIWDKGEVQSKRNSTMNRNTGYVKCINCYEHIFIFKKGIETKVLSDVKKITPVIKINCNGENTYKHTAPYPYELVDILKPFVRKNRYVLDPFLGSGTTLVWCKKNKLKGLGFELNKTYFELAKENINKEEELTSFG
ncbi:MAG: site-specific DNA-methyltransferase [Spirochaetaceae bacterium]|nr:site-specific DNA-methyltransferase [Spirochaetaceae bacterium]